MKWFNNLKVFVKGSRKRAKSLLIEVQSKQRRKTEHKHEEIGRFDESSMSERESISDFQ